MAVPAPLADVNFDDDVLKELASLGNQLMETLSTPGQQLLPTTPMHHQQMHHHVTPMGTPLGGNQGLTPTHAQYDNLNYGGGVQGTMAEALPQQYMSNNTMYNGNGGGQHMYPSGYNTSYEGMNHYNQSHQFQDKENSWTHKGVFDIFLENLILLNAD